MAIRCIQGVDHVHRVAAERLELPPTNLTAERAGLRLTPAESVDISPTGEVEPCV